MDAPNKYISILLIAAVLYGGYTLLFSSAKKKKQTVPPPLSNPAETPKQAYQFQPAAGKAQPYRPATIEKMGIRRDLTWSRDPFLYPKGLEPNRPQVNLKDIKFDEPPLLNCKVTSILISGGQKVATIDRAPYIVTAGDYIDNERVLDIARNRIVLQLAGRKHEITMENTVPEIVSLKGTK